MDSFNSESAKIIISADRKQVEISDGVSEPKTYPLNDEGITITNKKGKLKVRKKMKLKRAEKKIKYNANKGEALSLVYDGANQKMIIGATDISSGKIIGATDISSGRIIGATDISSGRIIGATDISSGIIGATDISSGFTSRGEDFGISLSSLGGELTVESGKLMT